MKVILFVDSLLAFKAVLSSINVDYLNILGCREAILKLRDSDKLLAFQRIPAHCGMCSRLPQPDVPLSYNSLRRIV
uniref:Putative secreted protein n=1 Tax=Panstrongylus lignarius TaxID=156445 RepID=A0A224Y535_9HEMI